MKWFILALAVLMYVLVIVFQNKKVWFSSIAALLIVAVGMIFPNTIFPLVSDAGLAISETGSRLYALTHSVGTLVNWNVLMIYVGSMMIASLFIYSKVPAYIADAIVSSSPNTGIAMVLILAMTGIISIFVENVATVLVMAPIALALSRKLKINPTYFMVGLAVMSNLEGTATLVGDPPSMIFASYAGYTFNDFFISHGKISIFFFMQIGMIAGCIFFYTFFSRDGKKKVEVDKTKIVSVLPAVLLLLMIFGLAAISFLHIEFPFASGLYVMILGVLGLVWYYAETKKDEKALLTLIKELDWETIFFLIGIFIVVGAISEAGLLASFAHFLAGIIGGSKLLGFILILAVSIIISGFVDNVPYIIIMLPVADHLALSLGIAPELYMFALLIGSCLGGNLTPYGASANVVAMGILKKEGYPINFAGWLKIGAPFTILTTAVAAFFLYLVWA
jgi:Na+/H+ antiporter NhaD/arsenite permease-like protein